MKSLSTRLAVETLDARELPSAVAYGDFNNDGRVDVAAITAPTVTVSLANPDGSYTVSAVLSAPGNHTLSYVDVRDVNGDGKLDISAVSNSGSYSWTTSTWLGNGDGTFGAPTTDKSRFFIRPRTTF
jgi:hypothetical protein